MSRAMGELEIKDGFEDCLGRYSTSCDAEEGKLDVESPGPHRSWLVRRWSVTDLVKRCLCQLTGTKNPCPQETKYHTGRPAAWLGS